MTVSVMMVFFWSVNDEENKYGEKIYDTILCFKPTG